MLQENLDLISKNIEIIVSWCNGSTADFGSACLGSSPGETAHELNILNLWG